MIEIFAAIHLDRNSPSDGVTQFSFPKLPETKISCTVDC